VGAPGGPQEGIASHRFKLRQAELGQGFTGAFLGASRGLNRVIMRPFGAVLRASSGPQKGAASYRFELRQAEFGQWLTGTHLGAL